MTFAFADPPYLGLGAHYLMYHPDALIWNDLATHQRLIDQLVAEYPDGWVLSLSSTTLRDILPLCPADVRVGAWCKSFCSWKPGVRPKYAWEPVIFTGGRNPSRGHRWRQQTTPDPRDFLVCASSMNTALFGAKPTMFCEWVLDLLNYQSGDTLVDLFPGTGIMGRTVEARACALPFANDLALLNR